MEEKDPQAAIELYHRIVEIDPSNAFSHVNLGRLYHEGGRLQLAAKHYCEAIKFDRNCALAHFDYANVLDDLRHFDASIREYEIALKICPTYGDALFNLADLLERRGQPSQAFKYWRKFIALHTNDEWENTAKQFIKERIEASGLKVVRRKYKPKRSKIRAALELVHVAG